jgi:DNA topoisomerase-2
MHPYYKGFKGNIVKLSDTNYLSKGVYSLEEDRLVITELPIGEWTDKYIRFLEESILSEKSDMILEFDNHSTEEDISIKIKLSGEFIYNQKNFVMKNGFTEFEKKLKLVTPISLTNIHAYDKDNVIKKYTSPYQILDEHKTVRLIYYKKRKDYILKELNNKLCILENKIRFIKEVIAKTILVSECTKQDLLKQLFDKEYNLFNDSIISDITTFDKVGNGYDYMIKMPIYTLSSDKVKELNDELNSIKDEIDIIFNKDIKTMWTEELDELLHYYKKINI